MDAGFPTEGGEERADGCGEDHEVSDRTGSSVWYRAGFNENLEVLDMISGRPVRQEYLGYQRMSRSQAASPIFGRNSGPDA